MEKEQVKVFDLEAAFKALDEIDIPVVKGIRPQTVNLRETFKNKQKTDLLIEDYYDVNSKEDLEAAKDEREAEIAQAKLARIEKIVDLNAETAEDLLPSYVGKLIIQCPQCMTLFYKDSEDLVYDEEDPSVVNVGEVCQHCGNEAGYTVIGKVDEVSEEEKSNYEAAEEEVSDEEDLTLEEIPEETVEETEETEETTVEEEPVEETEEEEEVTESLNLSDQETENDSENKTENVTLNEDGNSEWNSLSTKPRDLLSKIKNDPNYKATNDYIFFGTDGAGNVIETKKYHRTSRAIEDLKAARDEFFNSNDKFDTVYVSRYFKNNNTGDLEEVAMDIYTVYRGFEGDDVEEGYKGTPEERTTHLEYIDDDPTDGKAVLPDNIEKQLTEEIDKDLDAKLKAHNEYIDYLKKMIEQEEEALKKATNEEVKAAIQRRLDAFNDDLEAALPEAVKEEVVEEELPTPEEANEKVEAKEAETVEKTEEVEESLNSSEVLKDAEKKSELATENKSENLSLNENLNEATDSIAAALEKFCDSLEESCKGEDCKEDLETEEKLAAYEKSLPEGVESKVVTEATDNFDVSDAEFHKMINDPVFNDFNESADLKESPSDIINMGAYSKILDKIEHAGESAADVEEDLEEEKEVEPEDLDESTFDARVTDYLTEVYSNVEKFETTACLQEDKKLIIEGNILFKSGNRRPTTFEFTEAAEQDSELKGVKIYEGVNKDFSDDKAFKLTCALENSGRIIATNKLNYKYSINETLVEGVK